VLNARLNVHARELISASVESIKRKKCGLKINLDFDFPLFKSYESFSSTDSCSRLESNNFENNR